MEKVKDSVLKEMIVSGKSFNEMKEQFGVERKTLRNRIFKLYQTEPAIQQNRNMSDIKDMYVKKS